MSFLAPIAGAVVGGLLGGDGGGEQQTASKEPWEPARKPLINSINTGQDLERYYQQNPFNPLQQQGYQNMFSDLDQFRSQFQPALMNFANNAMTSNYQRGPRNSQMEAMQGGMGGGMQTNMKQPMMMQQGGDGSYSPQGGGGLMGAMGQAQTAMGQNGLSNWREGGAAGGFGGGQTNAQYGQEAGGQMSGQGFGGMPRQGLLAAAQGAFSAPSQGNYGLLDFTELNPFTSTTNGIPPTPVAEKPTEKTPEDLAREEWERLVRSGEAYRGAGA